MDDIDRDFADALLRFLDAGTTPFHAAAVAAALLEGAGFVRLREEDEWPLEPGGRYVVLRNGSAVAAFVVGRGEPAVCGFRVVGCHTDSPCFKVKPGPCIVTADGYVLVNTEGYGGSILATWLDRPLSVAGRLAVRDGGGVTARLVDCRRALLTIPNLCIHFNRDVNNGYAYNKQIDMLPLLGLARDAERPDAWLADIVAAEAGVAAADVLDADLFVYPVEAAALIGPRGDLLSSPRIDNLSMLYAALDGLLRAETGDATLVLAAFDNEEVGSVSAPGAAGDLLPAVLARLAGSEDARRRACARSWAVSADTAHAVHPNHPGKHDPANRPVLGGGPAIKFSAAQRYVTTALTAALFRRACEAAGVPCQNYVNRSDIPGGSTIGPAMASGAGIATVDVGVPILAMHSLRELGHAGDVAATARALRAFYEMSVF